MKLIGYWWKLINKFEFVKVSTKAVLPPQTFPPFSHITNQLRLIFMHCFTSFNCKLIFVFYFYRVTGRRQRGNRFQLAAAEHRRNPRRSGRKSRVSCTTFLSFFSNSDARNNQKLSKLLGLWRFLKNSCVVSSKALHNWNLLTFSSKYLL